MTEGEGNTSGTTEIEAMREDLKRTKEQLVGARKDVLRLEEAIGMVEMVRSTLLTLKAIDQLSMHSPHVLDSNLPANRHNIIEEGLQRVEEIISKANILPF